MKKSDARSHASRSHAFHLQALVCFQAACRSAQYQDTSSRGLNELSRACFFSRLFIHLCALFRLAEECASEPHLKENAFTAPSKTQHTEDSLECLCQCLLRCCDSVWIPAVIVRAKSNTHICTQLLCCVFYHLPVPNT